MLSARRTLRSNNIKRNRNKHVRQCKRTTLFNISRNFAEDMARNRARLNDNSIIRRHVLFVPLSKYFSIILPMLRLPHELIITITYRNLCKRTNVNLRLMNRHNITRMKRLICHDPFPASGRIILIHNRMLIRKERRIMNMLRNSMILQRLPRCMFSFIRKVNRLPKMRPFLILNSMNAMAT